MVLLEMRIEVTLRSQGLVTERTDDLDVEDQLLLVGLDVRLVVRLELEGLAANAAGESRQRERALLLFLLLLGGRRILFARLAILVHFL